MKQLFKPLGIAAAVAAASVGTVNVANAQVVANNALGDLALVPYYTVNGEWITGIHIVNTSDQTQVVKFRFRRALDSLDALDFNVVMSPEDVYAGFLSDDENGNIAWAADDTTCTAPATTGGKLEMPAIYRGTPGEDDDAATGYVEIIAMGSPVDEDEPIALAAEHEADTLTPLDCAAVRSNFFANGVAGTTRGVIDNGTTHQPTTDDVPGGDNTFQDSDNVLKVSYFIRDNATGIEFGDNAVHIQDFLAEPTITNQQYGYLSGDLNGFDFPDLDGATPVNAGTRGVFDALRDPAVLGAARLVNEWTANPANGAALDWVVTMPGQYLMFDVVQYLASLADPENESCDNAAVAGDVPGDADCDYRDIPVIADITIFNREEQGEITEEGDLVVSPAPPGVTQALLLEKETNVISFGGNSVLGQTDVDLTVDLGQPYGWLSLAVASQGAGDQGICAWDPAGDAIPGDESLAAGLLLEQTCAAPANTGVPMIGFAAWARSVAANPDASYGRIVGHSFE